LVILLLTANQFIDSVLQIEILTRFILKNDLQVDELFKKYFKKIAILLKDFPCRLL